ncbi:MAG: ParB N-terminal domain-containing protein [Leptospirales bacterium]|nr:ParB N-terminal domain-containing protein [Leptospirales bacterium]
MPMLEKTIPVSSIDLSENLYKISKNFLRDELAVSVKKNGILRPPVVFPFDGGFRILTGYNRIEAARKASLEEIPVCICETPAADILAREALLKSFNDEIGPAGKLRLLSLLKNNFFTDEDFIVKICHIGLGIPEWVFDKAWLDKFEKLKQPVKDYFDNKDVPFNLIDTYMSLPPHLEQGLARQLEFFPLRINIFRKIVPMLLDIARRSENWAFPDAAISGRQGEQELLKIIFEERYPEYSEIKKRSDEIISALSFAGAEIDFPEFFEGGSLSVKITLGKRDGAKTLVDRAGRLDKELLQKLLDML